MRVTMMTKPLGAVRGLWLISLQVGLTYNLKDDVARELILNGCAIEERRFCERRRVRRQDSTGRRQTD